MIDVTGGNRLAGADYFSIVVEGTSAHGSAPNLGTDAIVAACTLVTNLQTIVSRNNDPVAPLVLTVGTLDGGTRFNVIANKVTMEGTVRHFRSDDFVERAMERAIKHTCEGFGARYQFTYKRLTSPVVNDSEQLNRIARDAVIKLYGEGGIGYLRTMMASEDFSAYMKKVPGIFCFVGSRNKTKNVVFTNHHERYDVDEDVLKRGAAVMAQFAVDYLADCCAKIVASKG